MAMAENKYFKQALSDFMLDAAGGGAVRHLVKQGLTVRQIAGRLDFPLPYEKVRKMAWEALVEQGTVLLSEPGTAGPEERAVYVKEQGEFGRTSFRRILVPEEDRRRTRWRELEYGEESVPAFCRHLLEACGENGRGSAYASCDFGILAARDAKEYQKFLQVLHERQREYLEGLPWPRKRVYHRLDPVFSEIILALAGERQYRGCCYFLKTGEKLFLR